MRVVAHLLAPSGAIPNHPRWPLLVYPQAIALTGPDPAAIFEARFTANAWPAAWRNGVFPFHHYHSKAHEVLGIYEGEVTVRFGGEDGVVVTARPGGSPRAARSAWSARIPREVVPIRASKTSRFPHAIRCTGRADRSSGIGYEA
jgi:hypothetical protein